jgi:hypothetical protein
MVTRMMITLRSRQAHLILVGSPGSDHVLNAVVA